MSQSTLCASATWKWGFHHLQPRAQLQINLSSSLFLRQKPLLHVARARSRLLLSDHEKWVQEGLGACPPVVTAALWEGDQGGPSAVQSTRRRWEVLGSQGCAVYPVGFGVSLFHSPSEKGN
jgi:hypothetical protein